MRMLMILTCVTFALTGCGKSGGANDGSGASALSVSGSYAQAFIMTSGDVLVLYENFQEGKTESRSYTFPNGNMFKGLYQKFVSDDIVNGEIHNVTLTYLTCPTINGQAVPASGSFQVHKIDEKRISVGSAMSSGSVVVEKIDNIDRYLADLGMSIAIEDIDCDGKF